MGLRGRENPHGDQEKNMAGDGGGRKILLALTERQRPHSSLQRMVTELSFSWTMELLQT